MTTTLIKKGAGTRSKQIDKREAIVEAARELFTTIGYETTTMAEVARKAGIAVGTVYLYYKNKQELLQAVCGDWSDKFVQYMRELDLLGIPHHKRARALVEASFRMCEEHQEGVQLLGLQPQMIGEEGKEKYTAPILEALVPFFEDGIAAGSIRPVDPQIAAVIAFGMVHGCLHQCFDLEGGQNQQRYIEALVDTLEHWLTPTGLLQNRES